MQLSSCIQIQRRRTESPSSREIQTSDLGARAVLQGLQAQGRQKRRARDGRSGGISAKGADLAQAISGAASCFVRSDTQAAMSFVV